MYQIDLYKEYRNARGDIALAKEDLLPLDTNAASQQCSKFGIHPKLPILQYLYNESDALFLTNIGVLTEPMDRENYRQKSLTQLFAHNASKFKSICIKGNETVDFLLICQLSEII